MAPLIVFVHIPKTGGTSIRVAAEHYFGHKKMLYDYGPNARLTSNLVNKWIYKREDFEGFSNAVYEGNYRFLSGHFPINKYQKTLHEAAFVSWLREPFSRLRSAFLHSGKHLGFEGSFRDFYTEPRFSNQQSRLLHNDLSKLDFIGITEQFPESLRQLNSLFGIELVQYKANKTDNTKMFSPQEKDLADIKRKNLSDTALYQNATKRLLKEAASLSDSPQS